MDVFRVSFPTLCELLKGTSFERDAAAAVEFAKSRDDIKAALDERVFGLNELMCLVVGGVVPDWTNSDANRLESDLATVVATVGIEEARRAYREKFLVEAKSKMQDPKSKMQDAKYKLEDVRYELAVTAKACIVFDAGSVELEKPIQNPDRKPKDWKNSDVFGTFRGQPVRIEITVLHEELPPAILFELDEFVRQTSVSSGFQITLRSVLTNQEYARWVRALIELLHDNHLAFVSKDVEIDGVRFEWRGGAYHCPRITSPFVSICFYDKVDEKNLASLRNIVYPTSTRPVTPKYVLEDHPNPPGVVTLADLPDAPNQVPVSTKVGQMLAGKLQQCDDGVVNIVAFGNPLQMHDQDVVDAVRGPAVYSVPFQTDQNGLRHFGKGAFRPEVKAPFVPGQHLANDSDRDTFVKPFKKMSAVWLVRFGCHSKSVVIPNPNAVLAVPADMIEAFSDPVPPSNREAESTPEGSPRFETQAEEESLLDEEVVCSEMAQGYVLYFNSLEEAKVEFDKVAKAGRPLAELQRIVDGAWLDGSSQFEGVKLTSPSCEEFAMTFVVDCGGYDQAMACLQKYTEEVQRSADPQG